MRLVVGHTWDGVPVGEDERVLVELRTEGDSLVVSVDAPYHRDPVPDGPVGALDGLWNHEVVELFVTGPGDDYLEVELGPHGHHLVLQLRGVRQAVARCLPIAYVAQISGSRWTGTAHLPARYLPEGTLRVNAYAIWGDRRYLCATPLPGPAPDFHQPARFVVPLPAEGS